VHSEDPTSLCLIGADLERVLINDQSARSPHIQRQAKVSEAWERYVLNSHKPPETNSTAGALRLAAEWCGYTQETSNVT